MKSINGQGIITSIRAKKDGSLGLSISTPELHTNEKVAFMELQGIILKMFLVPLDYTKLANLVIDKEAGEKSPSQRLRAAMYVYWKEMGFDGDFNIWYKKQVDKIIEGYLNKIN